MSSKLPELKVKRAQIKGALTRFHNYITKQDPLEQIQLESRLASALKLLDEFNALQSQIELEEGVDFDQEQIERADFEDNYFDITSHAKQLINNKIPPIYNHLNAQGQAPALPKVQLPTLELPQFNGKHDEWLQFRDTYQSLIHNSSALTSTDKFYYLNSCIRGDAAQVIKSLEISDANYDVAWNLLRERYDNTYLIVKTHIKALFELPNVAKESFVALRKLIDNFKGHIRSLKSLGKPVEHWDDLLIYLIASKLDHNTSRDWERICSDKDTCTFDELIGFLNKKCIYLETCNSHIANKYDTNIIKHNIQMSNNKTKVSNVYISSSVKCIFCQGLHPIYNCQEFLKLPIDARISEIKGHKLCLNCLRGNHTAKDCNSSSCKRCKKRHNTLLHIETNNHIATISPEISADNVKHSHSIVQHTNISNHTAYNTSQVLLSTAIVQVSDIFGKYHNCRALLDNGAQSNIITSSLCKKLKLPTEVIEMSIGGIGKTRVQNVKEETNIRFQARHSNYTAQMSCIVLSEITESVPRNTIETSHLKIPPNLLLADPSFNQPGDIDMLIGAGLFWELLCIGQFSLGKKQPIMQKTRLGWIISGPLTSPIRSVNNHVYCNFVQNLNNNLEKFWELEEVDNSKQLFSPEEAQLEQMFVNTTTRDYTGRFIVRLPFKENIMQLGESKQVAIKRFYSLEKRLANNPVLQTQYTEFMREYEHLGHMTKLTENNQESDGYYLPHHAVVKEGSLTTKLRVVFDGSAQSSSGLSINDCQMIGPVLQDDLFSITVRFRKHPIILTADVSKMYRQVRIHESDVKYQKIIWRESPTQPVQVFGLNTVTYGTGSASYLAIRCLQQTAHDFKYTYPHASSVILSDFYVDDFISGAQTVEEAINLRDNVITILSSGGFQLRKWISNDSRALKNIADRSDQHILNFSENDQFKTLGLQWQSNTDTLQYHITQMNGRATKRSILSCISKIFDPLGLLGPVIVVCKLIIQQLWQFSLDWDESIPSNLHTQWTQFYNALPAINSISVPRYILSQNAVKIELHGFSDASEKAYGCCIYITSYQQDNVTSALLCAKSRVAPVKNVSIPRLELCGALLLARLVDKVIQSIQLEFSKVQLWSDSTIVLSWLKTSPNQLKTFVANRVAEIQTLTNAYSWKHVKSEDNPADLISRGISPDELADAKIWWHGPNWLCNPPTEYSQDPDLLHISELPETRITCITHLTTEDNISTKIFERFSNLRKLQTCIAYCLRFINNCRITREIRSTGDITVSELNRSLICLIKIAQLQSFEKEYNSLIKTKSINKKSSIITLYPFFDEDFGVIRVGGRLKNSNFDYDKKHPILLPTRHVLTDLIIMQYHKDLNHAGPQLTLASMRESYWPISGKNNIKRVIFSCVRCFRTNPCNIISPPMGELPSVRITPARPFYNCGVDYAGPVFIKDKETRGSKLTKAYICLFVCFVTKAIHLELVSDLTTDTFIAALRRFTSRRGKCQNIYSDNATNFVGANNELKELARVFEIQQNRNKIIRSCNDSGINWHFIPPGSPHFGGLWEAGVKSVKFHLRRVTGNANLTFEKFYTILTQIEACLNSRPLYPMSNDPNDLSVLTPGHFLIGESLTSLPDPDLTYQKIGWTGTNGANNCFNIFGSAGLKSI